MMFHSGKNFRELDHKLSLTESVIEMLPENSCTLYVTRLIPLNIVVLRKVGQAKEIKSTKVYDKW